MTSQFEKIVMRIFIPKTLAEKFEKTDINQYPQSEKEQPNNGELILGSREIKENIFLGNILDDLDEIGLGIQHINIINNGGRFFLYISFGRENQLDLSDEIKFLIRHTLNRVFAYIQVYKNPDKKIAINLGVMRMPEFTADFERHLRISVNNELFFHQI